MSSSAVEKEEAPLFLLVDNGSVRPAATLALRSIANGLSKTTGFEVRPASLAHSNRIPREDLEGEPAERLIDHLLSPDLAEDRSVVILPFFLGNRGAIVRMVEKTVAQALSDRPSLKISMAPFLFEEDGEDQDVLARAAASRILDLVNQTTVPPNVILVDHGSPYPLAAQVRNFVAGQVQALVRDRVRSVIPASMERREGSQYQFTEPLLSEVLLRPRLHDRPVILSFFFLLPGRHAGEGGDVAEICAEARQKVPSLEILPTALLGDHPIVVEALEKRIRNAASNG